MFIKRPVSWFLTNPGKQLSFALVTGTGAVLTSYKYVLNTFFLDKYKENVHLYSNSKPVPLADELSKKFNNCMDELKISDFHRKLISPFNVYGFDLFNAGLKFSKYGVAVGIPVNFSYKSLSDVMKTDITVNQKPIDWDSEVGQSLAESLLLPENVQRFAMCREILMTQNHKLILQSIFPLGCTCFAYTAAQIINIRFNLYSVALLPRVIMYIIVTLFSVGLYFLLNDMTEVFYETKVDEQLSELGPEYIESGVLFYDKLLQRNRALRNLMGAEGENKYSAKGNENFFLRQPRVALIHRKQYFENKLAEVKSKINE